MSKPFDKTEWPLGWMAPVNWHKAEFINAFHNWREKWEPRIVIAMAIARKVNEKHRELVEEFEEMKGIELVFSSNCELDLLEELLRV